MMEGSEFGELAIYIKFKFQYLVYFEANDVGYQYQWLRIGENKD